MAMRTIALAIPLEKVVAGDVFGQWLTLLIEALAIPPAGIRFKKPYRFRPAYIVPARNGLTEQALAEPDWTDFLFWDSDILPAPGMLERLAELVTAPPYLADNGGVICGAYYLRSYPFEVQLFNPHPEAIGVQFIHPARWLAALKESQALRDAGKPAPLYPVGGGGTGIMLIRRDVLERLRDLKAPKPIWEAPPMEGKLLEQVRAQGDDRAWGHWTEDVFFCVEVAQRLGIQVYGDSDLRFTGAHMGDDRVGPQHYIASHTLPEGYESAAPTLPKGYEVVQPQLNRAERRRRLAGGA
jgi:hypothetical protein